MKKVAVVITLLLLVVTTQVFAVSESALLFLLINPGVRAGGMGEAFAGIADDVSAVYWNPGGLGFQTGKEFMFMHSNWLPQLTSDLFYDFAAYKHSVEGVGTFGVSVTYLNLGEQIITDETSPEALGTFSSWDGAVALSYGTLLTEKLGLGSTLRLIRSNLAPMGAGQEQGSGQTWAFNFDLGLLRRDLFTKGLNVGLNLQNIGPHVTYIDADQADPQPANLKIGLAYRIIDSEYNRMTLAIDANKLLVTPNEGDEKADPIYKAMFTSWTDEAFDEELREIIPHIGLEYWYNSLIALRAGYYHDEEGKVKPWTFGFGLRYHLYQLDFGYIAAGEGHPLSDTIRFSLQIGFK